MFITIVSPGLCLFDCFAFLVHWWGMYLFLYAGMCSFFIIASYVFGLCIWIFSLLIHSLNFYCCFYYYLLQFLSCWHPLRFMFHLTLFGLPLCTVGLNVDVPQNKNFTWRVFVLVLWVVVILYIMVNWTMLFFDGSFSIFWSGLINVIVLILLLLVLVEDDFL